MFGGLAIVPYTMQDKFALQNQVFSGDNYILADGNHREIRPPKSLKYHLPMNGSVFYGLRNCGGGSPAQLWLGIDNMARIEANY